MEYDKPYHIFFEYEQCLIRTIFEDQSQKKFHFSKLSGTHLYDCMNIYVIEIALPFSSQINVLTKVRIFLISLNIPSYKIFISLVVISQYNSNALYVFQEQINDHHMFHYSVMLMYKKRLDRLLNRPSMRFQLAPTLCNFNVITVYIVIMRYHVSHARQIQILRKRKKTQLKDMPVNLLLETLRVIYTPIIGLFCIQEKLAINIDCLPILLYHVYLICFCQVLMKVEQKH